MGKKVSSRTTLYVFTLGENLFNHYQHKITRQWYTFGGKLRNSHKRIILECRYNSLSTILIRKHWLLLWPIVLSLQRTHTFWLLIPTRSLRHAPVDWDRGWKTLWLEVIVVTPKGSSFSMYLKSSARKVVKKLICFLLIPVSYLNSNI